MLQVTSHIQTSYPGMSDVGVSSAGAQPSTGTLIYLASQPTASLLPQCVCLHPSGLQHCRVRWKSWHHLHIPPDESEHTLHRRMQWLVVQHGMKYCCQKHAVIFGSAAQAHSIVCR